MNESLLSPLHRYVSAFNARDSVAMAAVFSPLLTTIHPGEPEVDVTSSEPFLQRMQALWLRDIHYQLKRFIRTETSADHGEVWGELIAYEANHKAIASELVLYRYSNQGVYEICVYKQLNPTHPAYC